MAQEKRTKQSRIERLRSRLRDLPPDEAPDPLIAVIKGILDLLEDEL